jgi:aminopeptidase
MGSTKVGTLEYGAMQAVRNCVRVKPGEKVVIITDNKAKHIADEIHQQIESISPGKTRLFVMEHFGERPEDGSHPLPFPDEIGKALQDGVHVSFYAAQGKKGELQSFRTPMLKIVEAQRLRHGHMPNITDLLMTTGMAVDYAMVQDISKKVFDIVSKARSISVKTPAGTAFTGEFNPQWRWQVSDGLITAEKWSNLPDGEVFTCVERIAEGTIVIDGVLGDYFCERYGILETTPVSLKIKNSRVIEASCKNETLLEDLRQYMKQDENADRIGEFAIGTNIGLERLVGNLLQDEKFPGVHIAIGHGYPDKTGSNWHSEAHVDGVMKDPTIIVDGTTIMERGKFLL